MSYNLLPKSEMRIHTLNILILVCVQTACAQSNSWVTNALKESGVTLSKETYKCDTASYNRNDFEGHTESQLKAIHPFSRPVGGHLLLKHRYSHQYYSKTLQKFESDKRLDYFDYDLNRNSIEKLTLDSLLQPVFFDDDTLIVYHKKQKKLFKWSHKGNDVSFPYLLNEHFLPIVIADNNFQFSPNKEQVVILSDDPRGGELLLMDKTGNKKKLSTSPQFAHWLSDSLLLYPKDVCVDTAIQDFTVYCLELFNSRSRESNHFYSQRVFNVYSISKSNGQTILYGSKYNVTFSRMSVDSDMKGVRSYALLQNINQNFDFFYPTKTNAEFIGLKLGPFFYDFCLIRSRE